MERLRLKNELDRLPTDQIASAVERASAINSMLPDIDKAINTLSSLPSDSEKAARERSRIRAMDFLKWYEHSDYRNTPKTVSELYIIFNTLNPE